mgnify:CR=1 FL=1
MRPIIALALLAASVLPQTGLAADGRATGEIGGHAFDLPVTCGEMPGGGFDAKSHDMFYSSDRSDVEPAVRVSTFNGNLSVTLYAGGTRYQFGSMGVDSMARPLVFEGDIRSKRHGSYEARVTVDCP